jgi:hypothetical protein
LNAAPLPVGLPAHLKVALLLAASAVLGLGSIDPAAASQHWHGHRHRVISHSVRHFVFASPQEAARASAAGEFGATFSTGILGASTADPYAHKGYGYGGNGYYGPGFAYPGY